MVVGTPAEERLVSISSVVASLPVIGLRAQPSWKGSVVRPWRPWDIVERCRVGRKGRARARTRLDR